MPYSCEWKIALFVRLILQVLAPVPIFLLPHVFHGGLAGRRRDLLEALVQVLSKPFHRKVALRCTMVLDDSPRRVVHHNQGTGGNLRQQRLHEPFVEVVEVHLAVVVACPLLGLKDPSFAALTHPAAVMA